MYILITGGLGFIGSHTIVELVDAGYRVIIIDNCVNSKRRVKNDLEKILETELIFIECDLKNKKELFDIFINYSW